MDSEKLNKITLNGKSQPVSLETIKGVTYAMIPVNTGFACDIKVYYE